MRQEVLNEMVRIVDQVVSTPDLNDLMKQFIQEKAGEHSVWSELTEYSYRMLGGTSSIIYEAAALTELMILTLDIVDDLQDRDKEDKSWMLCPEPYTLNALLAFMTGFMGEVARLQTLSQGTVPLAAEVSRILAESINGQQKDINQSIVQESDYMAMVQEKSGSLLRLACCMGYSFVENCSQTTIDQMNELAGCIGIMAQIDNDVKDLKRFDLHNDLLQKKRTLPILYMLNHCEEEFPVLKQFYEGDITQEDFLKHKLACMQYIDQCGCIEYSKIIQSLYGDRAEQLFDSLPVHSPWKEKWREITLASFDIHQAV